VLERDGLIGMRSSNGMEVLVGDQRGLVEVLEIREAMEGLAADLRPSAWQMPTAYGWRN